MQLLLTDLITLRLYAHQCHVLVTGDDALHVLLGAIYEAADDGIDPVAEAITAGGDVPSFAPDEVPTDCNIDMVVGLLKSVESKTMDKSFDLIDQQITTGIGMALRTLRNRLEHHMEASNV